MAEGWDWARAREVVGGEDTEVASATGDVRATTGEVVETRDWYRGAAVAGVSTTSACWLACCGSADVTAAECGSAVAAGCDSE